jgi:hypothetical protein
MKSSRLSPFKRVIVYIKESWIIAAGPITVKSKTLRLSLLNDFFPNGKDSLLGVAKVGSRCFGFRITTILKRF